MMDAQEDIFFAVERNRTGDVETGKAIHSTINKLPKAAQEVARGLQWISVGRGLWGLADTLEGDAIILSDDIPDSDIHSVIAHEIAHHILHKNAVASASEHAIREGEASSMARAWGFTGAGADVGANVADGLGGLWRYRVDIPEDVLFERLSQYEQWEAAWGLRAAALWEALESILRKEAAQILEEYREARSQVQICGLWARGEGGKVPKPPPTK